MVLQLEEKLREFGLVFDHVELRAAFKPGTGVGIGFGFAVLGSDRSVAEVGLQRFTIPVISSLIVSFHLDSMFL